MHQFKTRQMPSEGSRILQRSTPFFAGGLTVPVVAIALVGRTASAVIVATFGLLLWLGLIAVARSGKGNPEKRHAWQLTAVILTIGLVVSLGLWAFLQERDRQLIQRHFVLDAIERIRVMEQALVESSNALILSEAFFASSDSVERDEFQLFADRLRRTTAHRSLVAMEWLPRLTRDGREAFESELRSYAGSLGFIKQLDDHGLLVRSDDRSEFFPVTFVEPVNDLNSVAFGLDHACDPSLRKAMDQARDTARPVASERLTLFRSSGSANERSGVLVFMPVYRSDTDLETVEQRRESLRGFIACVLRFEAVFQEISNVWPGFDLEFFLQDVSDDTPRVLYVHSPSPEEERSPDTTAGRNPYHFSIPFYLFSREYCVTARPSREYIAAQQNPATNIIFAACLLLTSLLAVFVHRLQRVTQQSQRAEQTTRAVLDATLDPLICIDAVGIIQSASSSVERVFGWTPSELVGQNISVLMPEPYRSSHDGYLAKYHSLGVGNLLNKPRELQAQRRDGTVFACEVSISKVRTTDHSPSRFAGTIRDISARKQAEAKVEELQKQFVESAHQAGKAEIATSVLHNVGNVLNSVNVSVSVIKDKFTKLGVADLRRATALIDQHRTDLGKYVTDDPRGKHLADFLSKLADHATGQEQAILDELKSLTSSVDHVKDIIMLQQSHANASGLIVDTSLDELLRDAIRINAASADRHHVNVVCDFEPLPVVRTDKNKLMQIVVNLISNAKCALVEDTKNDDKQVSIRLYRSDENTSCIEVEDNGVGILNENLTRIFAYGFTTREDGHGFGLHSSVLAAKEMGGELTVHSNGEGCGAMFRIEIPLTISKPEEVALCESTNI